MKINKRINDEMFYVKIDYKRREAESNSCAGKTYFNC